MMLIQKWDFKTHKYEPHLPPDGAVIVLYTLDMDLPINCTNCLKDMTFGEGYTSHQYHTNIGLGYPVCAECYDRESNLRQMYKEVR